LPTLLQFRPILADEGTQVSFSEILKRWLDLLGVEGSDRVFQRSAREAPAFAREAATPASGMDHESVPYAPPTTTDAGVHAAILQKAALQAAP
jgi:hypothetical protein